MWWWLIAACLPKAPVDAVPRAEKGVILAPLERPANLSFEDGYDGWALGGDVDGDRDAFVAADGDWSLRMHVEGETWGSWTQCVSASEWKGSLLTLRGRLRTAGATGEGAGLWLRVDGDEGSGRRTLAFDNSADRRVTGDTGWTDASVELPVEDAATGVCFGLLLIGEGTAWADALAFARRDVPPPAPEPTAMTDRGVANLALLGRIWGAARYFVPPVEGVEIDWDAILLDAIPVVEAAEDDEALALALRRAFAPAHGAVRISGEAAVVPAKLPPGAVLVADAEADPAGASAVVVDLRGGVDFPEALQERIAIGPTELPRTRWTLHEGFYPLDPWREMEVVLPEERTGRLESSGKPTWPPVTLLVDDTTRPDVLGAVVALQQRGVRVVGEVEVGSPEPGWRVDLPGGGVAEVLVRPFAQAVVPAELEEGDPLAALVPAAPEPVRQSTARTRRLGNVLLVWATFEWFYPYWEDAGPVDWDALRDTALRDVATADAPMDFGRAVRAMLAPTLDGHAYFNITGLAVPQWAAPIAFSWSGDEPVVADAWGAAAEVAAGDVLVSVDGVPIAERIDALGVFVPTPTPQARWLLMRWLTGGEAGDTVLGLRALDGTVREVTVPREVHPNTLSRRDLDPGDGVRDLGDVLYIDLDVAGGDGERTDAILAALDRAGKAKGLVLDLRNYPDWEAAEGIVAHLASRPARTMRFEIPWVEGPGSPTGWDRVQEQVAPLEPHLDLPVAVLIDGRCLSRCEHYAAIFKDNDLATLVGTATAGTNGEVVDIHGFAGFLLSFTGMRAVNADGSRHLGVGVLPDIVVERTPEAIAEGRDEQLERAIEIVSE